jgi:hypothetical protein
VGITGAEKDFRVAVGPFSLPPLTRLGLTGQQAELVQELGRAMTEKSALQVRAEAAAAKFHVSARSAIVIEFAGVPKAGKTTTLGAVQAFLRRCGFRVNVVVERASVCPIKDKKDSNFNIWTACTTLVQILDQTQIPPSVDDPEILILDRGILDSIW